MLLENMLIKYEGKDFRILYINRITGISYGIDMNEEKWPVVLHLQQNVVNEQGKCNASHTRLKGKDKKEKKYKGDEVEVLSDEESRAYNRLVFEEEMSDSQRLKRDSAYEVTQFILNNIEEEQLYIRKYRLEIITKTEKVFNLSSKTIKKYLIRYWRGGKTRNALIPTYYLCGGKGKEKQLTNQKTGRPRDELGTGVNVTGNIKAIFSKVLNKYYYNSKKNTLKMAYEFMIKEYFAEEIQQNGVKVPIIKDIDAIPSYQQFLYWYKKNNNIKKEVSRRNSTKEYYQLNRAIVGTSNQDAALGPGTLYQIDSTIFDVYLVSSQDRDLVVGRPVFYSVMDVYSRCIVGINVTFEAFNSYVGGMVALENTMSNKVGYCKKYGVDITEKDWPIHHVPQRILADRGELEGKQIETAIANLGITIQNAPPYRGDMKGIIESSFRGLHLLVKPHVDGVVTNSKNILERGEKDYRLNANMNLYEFTQIIIKCVLFHNNHHVLSDYIVDEMQLQDNTEKIPLKIWEHGAKNLKGTLRTLPEDVIRLNLLPTRPATVSAKGIVFKKMVYLSEEILKSNILVQARTSGSWRITVSYDPRDSSFIYMKNEEDSGFEKLTLVDVYDKYRTLSEKEVEMLIEKEKSLEKECKNKELQAKMGLIDDIEKIVKKARQGAIEEQNPYQSKSEKLRGIKENLQKEREIERESIQKQEEKQVFNVKDEIELEEDSELALFMKIQQEGQ